MKAEITPNERDTLRVGVDLQRYRLDDQWAPVANTMMMAPDTFWNIRNGQRDRHEVYAEWEAAWSPRWLTLAGVRGTMGKVMQSSPNSVFQTLQPALNTGYLLTIDHKYRAFSLFDEGINESFEHESVNLDVNFRFLHDRVQQAAYALISAEERPQMHLKTARILLDSTPANKLNDLLFDIDSHYSHAHNIVEDPGEKISIADLYLKAGTKAKDSTSYDVAIKYLDSAKDLLPGDSWKTYYKLTFEIYAALSECESLNGQHDKAEVLFDQVLNNAQTKLAKN